MNKHQIFDVGIPLGVTLFVLIAVMALGPSGSSRGGGGGSTAAEAKAAAARIARTETHPTVQAARKKAKDTWPTFVAAFNAKAGDQTNYTVWSKFVDGDRVEHLPVAVTSIDGQTVSGVLDAEPEYVTNVEEGKTVKVPVASVDDWVIAGPNGIDGGVTIKARMKVDIDNAMSDLKSGKSFEDDD